MADLHEQLQNILSNPEAMSQISAIAQSLSGGGQAQEGQSQSAPPDYVPVEEPPQESPSAQAPDLSALMGLLGGGGQGSTSGIDPKMIQTVLRLYGEYQNQDDRKVALLAALAPFVKEERRATLEKAERAARLARVIRAAMTLFREEGNSHV